MKKGVSLVSLIITIVVIIILASITVINSLDTAEDAFRVKYENEFNDVYNFVRNVSTRVEADMLKIDISGDLLASEEQVGEFNIENAETDLIEGDLHQIDLMNQSIREGEKNAKYGYYYITASQIENGIRGVDIPSGITNLENNYIINFYYGVVIAKISNDEVKVMGKIR